MTKKGPLSKAERFYIENHRDQDIKELCKDLDRAQAAINTFIKTLPNLSSVDSTKSAKKGSVSDHFARNESGGVVVMTPNASIMADEKRPSFKGTHVRSNKCTTKIKG
jgi:hypothetical protein